MLIAIWPNLEWKGVTEMPEMLRYCGNCLYNVLDKKDWPCSRCTVLGGKEDNWTDENDDGMECEECKLELPE